MCVCVSVCGPYAYAHEPKWKQHWSGNKWNRKYTIKRKSWILSCISLHPNIIQRFSKNHSANNERHRLHDVRRHKRSDFILYSSIVPATGRACILFSLNTVFPNVHHKIDFDMIFFYRFSFLWPGLAGPHCSMHSAHTS